MVSDEIFNLDNKVALHFKNKNKDDIIGEKDEEHYTDKNNWWFWEREIISDNVRDLCHLTGQYRWPAHESSNFNVSKKQISFLTLPFHIFNDYACHLFSKS